MSHRIALIAALLASSCLVSTAYAQINAAPMTKDKADPMVASATGDPAAKADTDMKKVLDAFAKLDPKPIEKLSPEEARRQPTMADAVAKVLQDNGKSAAPDASVTTRDMQIDGAAGPIPATIYTPAGASGTLPVIVYYHGGGFVIATNKTYDASARALSKMVGAVVVAVEYRKAPENKFPASHDDAIAAYKWTLANAGKIGGDARKIALAGESAGGNLAVDVAIAARDQHLQAPLHVLAVYPVAGDDLETPSYKENADAKPLNKPMMQWFVKHLTTGPQDLQDARIDLIGKADVKGLPPTTIITAQIDPLRSDGQKLADKMKLAGVKVTLRNYEGVTHEFFGMGAVVAKAKDAEDFAASALKSDLK